MKPGPRTEAGREAIKLNATRHGALSPTVVLPNVEREEDWEAHLAGMIESLRPVGYFEAHLVERIASSLWRLERVVRYEHDLVVDKQKLMFPLNMRAHVLPESHLSLIQRYEAHLHRLFVRDLHELEALQARRRGEPTPLARIDVDVDGLPGS